MYKFIKDKTTNEVTTNYIVKLVENGEMWIPTDESNTDYQQYLRWLEEGNVPTPAEENQ